MQIVKGYTENVKQILMRPEQSCGEDHAQGHGAGIDRTPKQKNSGTPTIGIFLCQSPEKYFANRRKNILPIVGFVLHSTHRRI